MPSLQEQAFKKIVGADVSKGGRLDEAAYRKIIEGGIASGADIAALDGRVAEIESNALIPAGAEGVIWTSPVIGDDWEAFREYQTVALTFDGKTMLVARNSQASPGKDWGTIDVETGVFTLYEESGAHRFDNVLDSLTTARGNNLFVVGYYYSGASGQSGYYSCIVKFNRLTGEMQAAFGGPFAIWAGVYNDALAFDSAANTAFIFATNYTKTMFKCDFASGVISLATTELPITPSYFFRWIDLSRGLCLLGNTVYNFSDWSVVLVGEGFINAFKDSAVYVGGKVYSYYITSPSYPYRHGVVEFDPATVSFRSVFLDAEVGTSLSIEAFGDSIRIVRSNEYNMKTLSLSLLDVETGAVNTVFEVGVDFAFSYPEFCFSSGSRYYGHFSTYTEPHVYYLFVYDTSDASFQLIYLGASRYNLLSRLYAAVDNFLLFSNDAFWLKRILYSTDYVKCGASWRELNKTATIVEIKDVLSRVPPAPSQYSDYVMFCPAFGSPTWAYVSSATGDNSKYFMSQQAITNMGRAARIDFISETQVGWYQVSSNAFRKKYRQRFPFSALALGTTGVNSTLATLVAFTLLDAGGHYSLDSSPTNVFPIPTNIYNNPALTTQTIFSVAQAGTNLILANMLGIGQSGATISGEVWAEYVKTGESTYTRSQIDSGSAG